jgi:hypothetical protein
MPSKGKGQTRPLPASPDVLYRDLPRKPGVHSCLLIDQCGVPRGYPACHTSTADLALELPTATGKTLLGLVIVERVRRVHLARVTSRLTVQPAAAA